MNKELTSSELAVCRSTAREKRSSSKGKTPSPSRQLCKHASSFRYSLTSRHSPMPIIVSTLETSFTSSVSTTSGRFVLATSTTAARKGILSGCSTVSCRIRSQKLPRSSSSSQLSVNRFAIDATSSCHARIGFSAIDSRDLRMRTCGGASKRRRGARRSKSSSSIPSLAIHGEPQLFTRLCHPP